jgi:polyisoprenoid-binding protein YceI
MRRMLLSVSALAVLLSSPLAYGSDWTIDSSHSNAQFAVRHFMVSTVRGTFGAMSGAVMLDEKDVTKSSLTAEIDVASVDTREAKRDEHLKGADFFDVEKHPKMTFVSKKVEKVDDTHYKMTGDMTLKGVTKEAVFEVEGSTTPIKDPWGNNRLGGVATATINRTDFGLTYNSALETGGVTIGEEVTITIDFELTPKKEEAKS